MDWYKDATKRSKTSHGHRSSSSHIPKRSQTPAFASSSSSRHGSDPTFSGRKHHKKRDKQMDILEEDEEDEGGGGASLRQGGGGQQASLSRRDPYKAHDAELLSPASQDFRAQASHSYWKWSENGQNWYHVDAGGNVSWAPRSFA